MDFPETTWGMVCRLRLPAGADRRAGLEALCHRYREPIRSYARAAWARSDDDANDLTQEFFVWLLEGDVLERYVPERGSFRHYLKGLLRNFGRNQAQAARRLKRGGGQAHVPIDDSRGIAEELIRDPRAPDPDEAIDRAWIEAVTRRAVERLRERLESSDRAIQWKAFEAYDLAADGKRPTYGAVATKLGIKESDVRNHLFAVRERLRTEMRSELLDTVADPRELEREWATLVGTG